ncbi:MAG: sodium:proton exchanger, partial [Candidatus Altiarchaeales archaeon]|nr:sodium:proton exchanger [Candidatus Altiarchaeales archaeon]
MIDAALLWDMGLMIVAATLGAHLARIFRQPLIVGYVLAGVIIGPSILGLITNHDVIRTFSELGIAFLLFIVGLELDLKKLASVGRASTIIALVNSTVMFCAGYAAAHMLGFTALEPVYMGLVLAISSTMVVIKILSDKNELETLHGRIILGILLVQDIIAITALSILSTIKTPHDLSTILFADILNGVFVGAGLFSIALVISRFILPSLFRVISTSHELLFITALSVFFLFTGLSQAIGFSLAVGAFVAGIAIATFPYNLEIEWKMKSLRDFFSTIFFVSLGMEIFELNAHAILISIPFIILILTLKPLTFIPLTSLLGYGRRVSFLTGASLTQISEFSLIIAMTGLSLGHIDNFFFSITAFIALMTFTFTG